MDRVPLRSFGVVIIIALLSIALSYLWSCAVPMNPLRDFVQYAASWNALQNGQNPYDPIELLRFENILGFQESKPMMFWSPPWTLLLMVPSLVQPTYEVGIAVWRGIGIFLMCLVLNFSLPGLLQKYKFEKRDALLIGIAALCSAPVINAISVGQSIPILMCAMTIFLAGIMSESFFIAGIAAAFFSIKPHLFFLIGPATIILIKEKKSRRFFYGFLLTLGAFVLLTEMFLPHSFAQWISTLRLGEDSSVVMSRENWICGTFGCYLRLINPNIVPSFSLVFMPLLIIFGVLGYFIYERRMPDLREDIVWMLPLSLCAVPYGWFFDFALLVPVQCIVIAEMIFNQEATKRRIFLSLYVLFTVLSLYLYLYVAQIHAQMWWYPLGIFIFISLMQRSKKRILSENPHTFL